MLYIIAMETYIHELTGAHLYAGSVQTAVGAATELTRPLAGCIAKKMDTLAVEPLPNGDVLVQARNPEGKAGLLVVPCKEASSGMGVSNALHAKGARLPRWVRYAIDRPHHPVVVYWREKSIR